MSLLYFKLKPKSLGHLGGKSLNTSNDWQPEELSILMLPDYRVDNPYQSLLSNALTSKGIQVNFWRHHLIKLPIFRAAVLSRYFSVVHLHWINCFIDKKTTFKSYISSIQFIIEILLIRLAGVRVVWTVHNLLSHDTQFPRLELWTRKVLVKLAHKIILHNKSVLESVAKEYGFAPAKAEIIPIGHYRGVYAHQIDQMEARRELGLPLNGRIYLSQGLLRPYKGVERLLKIWVENRAFFEGDTLLIAGKPLDESYGLKIRQMASGLEGIVLHTEFVEDEKMHLLFSAADVAVLPFEKILTSSSVVLAMSYGKPIVAPRLGGIAETMGLADSLLYNPDDEQGLLEALKKSTQIDLNEQSQLVIESCNRLDWSIIAEKTLKVYKEAALLKNRKKMKFHELAKTLKSLV